MFRGLAANSAHPILICKFLVIFFLRNAVPPSSVVTWILLLVISTSISAYVAVFIPIFCLRASCSRSLVSTTLACVPSIFALQNGEGFFWFFCLAFSANHRGTLEILVGICFGFMGSRYSGRLNSVSLARRPSSKIVFIEEIKSLEPPQELMRLIHPSLNSASFGLASITSKTLPIRLLLNFDNKPSSPATVCALVAAKLPMPNIPSG